MNAKDTLANLSFVIKMSPHQGKFSLGCFWNQMGDVERKICSHRFFPLRRNIYVYMCASVKQVLYPAETTSVKQSGWEDGADRGYYLNKSTPRRVKQGLFGVKLLRRTGEPTLTVEKVRGERGEASPRI